MIYEILYIIPSKYSDTEIEGIQGIVGEILAKNEAQVIKTENLGKIKLAYPIKKQRHGTYILTYANLEGDKLQKLDQDLRLTEQVLRHIMVRRPDGIPEGKVEINTYVEPVGPEGRRAGKKTATAKETPRVQEAEASEKISTEELDKKLDEILESDIVSGV